MQWQRPATHCNIAAVSTRAGTGCAYHRGSSNSAARSDGCSLPQQQHRHCTTLLALALDATCCALTAAAPPTVQCIASLALLLLLHSEDGHTS